MQLVQAMGGSMDIESELGKGSTFYFTIEFAAGSSDPGIAPSRNSLNGLRVLIVDDNATNRKILDHQLSAWGVQSLAVQGGTEALEELRRAAATQPYNLAILDCQMPHIDGLSLARRIREDPAIAGMRLLMMSSAGDRADLVQQSANFDAWLTKPARHSRLYETLVALAPDQSLNGSTSPAGKLDTHKSRLHPPLRQVRLANHKAIVRPDQKVRVLVAEDNVVNQKVALLQLQKLGLVADAVGNGREALEALGRIRYPIVLMDCQMPEMDGYATTAEIRKREAGQWHPIVIAMTAHAMSGDREKCLASGMDDYIGKPVKMEELEEVLARWIPAAVEAESA
jgi:CheY-like chemotaxis protein